MKKSFLLCASLALITPSLLAHEGHSHEAATETPPHGGSLRDAGDLKAEVVINGDDLKLYVYDKQLKPVKIDKAELKGEVQFPKEKAKPIVFKKKGDLYEATVKGISKVHRYDLHVNIEASGKKAKADFGIDNI